MTKMEHSLTCHTQGVTSFEYFSDNTKILDFFFFKS